jgi:hypothetical protein
MLDVISSSNFKPNLGITNVGHWITTLLDY